MPTHTPEELRALVAQARVGGISIDTSVFERYGCNLESATLSSVAELTPRHVAVVIPDIVAGELRNHMVRDAREAVDSVRRSLRMVQKSRRLDPGAATAAAALLELDGDVEADADARFGRFVDTTKAEVLAAADWLDATELLERYLAARTPFEATGKKKSEFPDAIALIELERWAAERQRFVIAVSTDDGWRRFAAEATWVTVVQDLPAALALFQEAEDELVARVAASLRPDARSDISGMVDASLERHVDNLVPFVEAHSFAQFEASFSGAEVRTWLAVEAAGIKVISSGATSVKLSFSVTVTIDAEAEFSFARYDGVDKDYVPLGSASVSRELTLPVSFVAEVERVEPENNVIILAAEERRSIELDFGNVEPDFSAG